MHLKAMPMVLGTLSTDPSGKLDVLGHDGDPLGMDGAQVGVLEQTNKVGLAGLLQGHHRRALEPQVGLEVLGNLTDQPLEWELPDEELGGLLVPPDLPEGNGAGPVAVGLLDSPSGRSRLASSFGGKLLSGGLASCRLPGGLFGSGHDAGLRDTDEIICTPNTFILSYFLKLSLGALVPASNRRLSTCIDPLWEWRPHAIFSLDREEQRLPIGWRR